MMLFGITKFESLLFKGNSAEGNTNDIPDNIKAGLPNLESQLELQHAQLINAFKKELDDYPEYPCCCCERLHQHSHVTDIKKIKMNINTEIWQQLKDFILSKNPNSFDDVLYLCKYCKPNIANNTMPPRCVLNVLQTDPIPEELSKLDVLSRQLIQRAHAFQTVVRLGTYTAKVPIYSSLKASKGTMFFLPLPLNKTLETINDINIDKSENLPSPELYSMINGKPAKNKVIWQSIVNVNIVKAAVNKLSKINVFIRAYKINQ